ncbi:SDR family NAD(P)-dependent oxidoreductase [Sulfitobacter sp.]|uniref:SDR family NAD(P)-dependent oxidoreductase n=1 Tax=Sulfitobacter sp. TaxID=1903071 RepID=UPI0030034748
MTTAPAQDMHDQHVIITGGGTGVGAQIALSFAQCGAQVTVLGRRIEPLQDVADRTGALALTADVTDRASLDAALDRAREVHGPVSIAIANAGAADSAPFSKMSVDAFQSSLDVNLTGVFNLWQAALPDMLKLGGGRMIAVASTAGLKGYSYVSHYCAAKHAVVGLTRALALELGPKKITVNAICPGFIETPLLEKSIEKIIASTGMPDSDARASLMSGNPQKRFVQTSEVAGAAIWLCSQSAFSVNGHALALSGGEV